MTLSRETTHAKRAGLLEHLAGDNGNEPTEWCDRHRAYVDEGRTQPMGPRSPYRICDACLDESRRQVAARPHETVNHGCSACDYGAHTECSACNCTWLRDIFDRNDAQDCCSDGGCPCHDAAVVL